MGIRKLKPRAPFDRTAGADLFRHTLARIPSIFGRLLYLGSLRDPNTGAYRHYGLSTAFGKEQSAQALVLSHKRTFREWLRLTLEERQRDLETYLESLDDPKGKVVDFWLEAKGYLSGVPDSASKGDRDYFASDLENMLTVLSYSAGGSRARSSSRRR